MKQYQKALLALETSGTASAKQNKFIKIAIETDDEQLKVLAQRVATMYSYYIKTGYARHGKEATSATTLPVPINIYQWKEMQRVVNQELRDYLTVRLAQGKPEWQVQAERHGWRPPY